MGFSFRLAARVLLHAQSHRQDSTYHSLCYTSRGALAGMRNSSMDLMTYRTMSKRSYHGATSRSLHHFDTFLSVQIKRNHIKTTKIQLPELAKDI